MAEGKQAARVTGEVKGKRSGKRLSISSWADSADVFLIALKLGLLAELFALFFADTVAPGRLLKLGALVSFFAIVLYAGVCNMKVKISLPIGLLLVFYAYVLIRQAFLGLSGVTSWFQYFGLNLVVATLLACCPERKGVIEFVIKAIIAFAFVHAVATIVLWLVPSLYDGFVYPTFFPDNQYGATGYKSGLTTHYSTNGMYLALGLVSCTYFVFRKGRGRIWALMAMAVFLFAILLTTKRAHLVFSLVAIAVAYVAQAEGSGLTRNTKIIVAAVIVVVVFAIAASFVPDLWDVVERITNAQDDDTFGGRAGFYELCLSMWGDNPLFGQGWSAFSDAFFKTPESAYRKSVGFTHMDAHNVFIQLLGEEGLFGLILYALAAAVSFCFAFVGARKEQLADEDGAPRLLTWSVAIQAFFLLYCITGNPLYETKEYIPYLLAVGCLAFTLHDLGWKPSKARLAVVAGQHAGRRRRGLRRNVGMGKA